MLYQGYLFHIFCRAGKCCLFPIDWFNAVVQLFLTPLYQGTEIRSCLDFRHQGNVWDFKTPKYVGNKDYLYHWIVGKFYYFHYILLVWPIMYLSYELFFLKIYLSILNTTSCVSMYVCTPEESTSIFLLNELPSSEISGFYNLSFPSSRALPRPWVQEVCCRCVIWDWASDLGVLSSCGFL